MFLSIWLYYHSVLPKIKGFIFKLLFSNSKLKIGKNFMCDTWPHVNITGDAKIIIGDNVQFRRNVELRSHNNALVKIEGNNRIDRGVRILGANDSKIIIGKGTRIGLYSVLNGGDSIILKKKILISGYVYLQTSYHAHSKNKDIQDQGYNHAPVEIEDDCWLGTHVVVMPGVSLAKGSVIGSNAVVTKSTEKDSVNVGIPAKRIKDRVS